VKKYALCYTKKHKPGETPKSEQEVIQMALSNLFGWKKKGEAKAAAACGTACGAGDKPEEKPAACGTACGAGDKPEEKAAACGTACGAGDKPEEKPAACGTACGAGDK
jgi:ACGX-repeat protein